MEKKNIFRQTLFSVLGLFLLVTMSCNKDDNTTPSNIVRDIDGNTYHTVKIGTQVWMVENLKTTKYRDGSNIPNITNDSIWGILTTGAYCDYDNTPSNSKIYGLLYNLSAVKDSRNIAPKGWHVPSEQEWLTLITYLGGDDVSGRKLKEIGCEHWNIPNSGATNETGFRALAGGYRPSHICHPSFIDIGNIGMWWILTPASSLDVIVKTMSYANNRVETEKLICKHIGCSVRCIKDTLSNTLP